MNESIRLHDLQLDYVRAQYPHRDALELIHGALRAAIDVWGQVIQVAWSDGKLGTLLDGLLQQYDNENIRQVREYIRSWETSSSHEAV